MIFRPLTANMTAAIEKENLENLKNNYTTVYSIGYSHCGTYLAAGSSFGMIAIFNLSVLLDCDDDFQLQEEDRKPFFQFKAYADPVYSLTSAKKFVISGSIGQICSWRWSDLKKKSNIIAWKFELPLGNCLVTPEVNCLAIDPKENENMLYAGCGDNRVYCIDMETATCKFTFEGHTDYIHSLALGNSCFECVSGSEDGSVRIWDGKKGGKEALIFEPYKHEMCMRPQIGKWIGCVAYDDNEEWLVCGGAPNLSMWYIRALAPATAYVKPDTIHNVVQFYQETIISGGSEPCINHWSRDGKLIAEVPSSSSSLFDLKLMASRNKQILCAAGCSSQIDLCLDTVRYPDFSLEFL